jgi:hypothetical protein
MFEELLNRAHAWRNGRVHQKFFERSRRENIRVSHALPKFRQTITEYKEWILTAPCFILFAGLVIVAIVEEVLGRGQSKCPKLRNQAVCFALAVLFGILLFPETAKVIGAIFTLTFILLLPADFCV